LAVDFVIYSKVGLCGTALANSEACLGMSYMLTSFFPVCIIWMLGVSRIGLNSVVL